MTVSVSQPASQSCSHRISVGFSGISFGVHDYEDKPTVRGFFPERLQIDIWPQRAAFDSITPCVRPLQGSAVTKFTVTRSVAKALAATATISAAPAGSLGALCTRTGTVGLEQEVPAWSCHALGRPGSKAAWLWQLQTWASGAQYKPDMMGRGPVPELPMDGRGVALPTADMTASWVLPDCVLGGEVTWNVSVSLECRCLRSVPMLGRLKACLGDGYVQDASEMSSEVVATWDTPLPLVQAP
jgi:hypothetical protein